MQAEAALEQIRTYINSDPLAGAPTVSVVQRVDWHRHGLMALHSRLEDLKTTAALLSTAQQLAASWQAMARHWCLVTRHAAEDVMADGLEVRVSRLATRGMAAEERMLTHRHHASAQTLMLQQFELAQEAIDAVVRVLNLRAYLVRDERNDIRAQIRLIQTAIEIQEI